MKVFRKRPEKGFIYFAPDEGRVRKFRKKYKEGDKIKARVLKEIDKNRVIIDVDGIKLIAYLKKRNTLNDVIFLEVKQLFPHIILKPATSSKMGVNVYI